MPVFFFHLTNDIDRSDKDGTKLDGIEASKGVAVQLIVDLLHKQPMKFWSDDRCRVTVADDQGLSLFTVEMFATLSPALAPARA